MSDYIYNVMSIMEKTSCELFNSLCRSKGLTLEISFTISHDIYDDLGNNRGKEFRFKVRYYSSKGSRYVRVCYRLFGSVDWTNLADHDTCWRESWDNIIAECRKTLNEDFPKIKGHEDSWFSNCESIDLDGEVCK